ncbi:MAG TPA: dihydrofolate reductase family protein, partial [Bacillota bacterium]|nr:dihydrofolate reductase family protein [Bacillota bacterium]
LVDKLMLFMAPLIIGGRESPTSFEGAGVARLEEAWRLKDMEIKQYDGDLLLIGYPLAPEKRNAEKGGGF